MKLGTRILCEALNQAISYLQAQPTEKASYRNFKNAKNLTFGSGYVLNALGFRLNFW